MALLLLIVIGVSAGWMASIVARTEAAGAILRQIGLGLIASLVAGLFMNSGTILGGLSWMALGVSVAASIVVLVIYHAVISRNAEA